MMEGSISLFLGALFDALIGPNLFIPGEPFMLAAGYQLHQGVLTGVVAVLLGGFLGDQASYFIGLRLGKPAQKKLIRWQAKTRRPIARCRLLIARRGNWVFALARLLGPVAWVVPFMAGTQQIRWQRFTFYSSIGLLLGVGQFVLWGYLLSYGLEQFSLLNEVRVFVVEHQLSFYVVGVALAVFFIAKQFNWRSPLKKSFAVLLMAAVTANYAHFFLYADDFLEKENATQDNLPKWVELSELSLKAYPGKSSVFDAQAVNILYFGDNPRALMSDMGWIENKTFSRHDLELTDYLSLMQQNTPPVSDLFWNDRPQEMAFQLPGNLLKRSHIRWWKAGRDPNSEQTVWVAALSYDNGLQLTPYSGIVTVLHSIDPDVDDERDQFAKQLIEAGGGRIGRLESFTSPIELDEEHDYFSDGRVLVINQQEQQIANLVM